MTTAATTTSVPPLLAVVDALAASADVARWIADVHEGGADARVSESVLPGLLAALNRHPDARPGERIAPAGSGRGTGRPRSLLVVAPTDAEAERIAEAVGWYVGEDLAAAYVSRGVPYGSGIAPAPARVGAREQARLVAARGGVVVASVAALHERAVPASARSASITLRVGDTIDRDDIIRRLVDAGYERTEQAEERGQVAVRGDIVDIFATTARHPARIELFDDEIEQVRIFSSFTQRSLGRLEEIVILPAAEVPTVAAGGAWFAEHADGDPVIEAAGGALEPAWRAFRAAATVVWSGAAAQRELEELVVEHDSAHVAAAGYTAERDLTRLLGSAVHLDALATGQRHEFDAEPPTFAALGFAEAEAELRGLVSRGLRVVVTFPHQGQAGRTRERLKRAGEIHVLGTGDRLDAAEAGAWFAISMAASGFTSRQLGIAVVPSARLFRTRVSAEDRTTRIGQAMGAFTSLRVGDFVVHEDQGIGRFAGFETKTVAGVTRDYLYIEFAGADRLYVPHEQMGKVTRYVGADGSAPTLSKLGGRRWHNLRNRARAAVRELAGELLALYAKRSRAVGHGFPVDDEIMERFELSFPFTETDDQLTAIACVKEDMERPAPMDRLICGDVGFGKTEVAMRAAVKAVSGGRQVMVLVPTTVLAQQHLVSFRERLEGLPIEVDMVSRFRTPKAIKEALARFAQGRVDILIGTHRLLSRDVLPRELGLVIVDEEQRFGVAQKELLRQMRLEVDVLSLSATPIPRTLHMSLTGMRDITVIETAPHGRRPIATHVGEYDEELVRMAIERELERDGQVFYLHNRVETIDEAAARIAQVVPRARIGIGHGQMPERQLERMMLGFLRRDFDVFVATTIIESGLDIPTANTLIVERADMLGLAQLYQIRGRVGRSTRSAHAYLFYPSARELTEEARARLTTLSDFTDLGSGSRIAMRDLELRGAGNLLGAEQSGHVAAVGFELYVEMLAEAVGEMSGQPVPAGAERFPTIDARVDAYVPADYVASEAIKIDLHRRIALARDEVRLDEIRAEIEDRFGDVPAAVDNLIGLARVRLLLARVGADRLAITRSTITAGPVRLAPADVGRLRGSEPGVTYAAETRELRIPIAEDADGLGRAVELLGNVADTMAEAPA